MDGECRPEGLGAGTKPSNPPWTPADRRPGDQRLARALRKPLLIMVHALQETVLGERIAAAVADDDVVDDPDVHQAQ